MSLYNKLFRSNAALVFSAVNYLTQEAQGNVKIIIDITYP